jgi:hypothetical protein
MRRAPLLLAGAGVLPAALGSSPAAAQAPSVDARTWRPSTDPEAGMVLEPALTPGAWQWNVSAWASYAHDPVTLRDAGGGVLARPVEHAIDADLVAGIGLGPRASVGLDLPVVAWQDGSAGLPGAIVTGGTVPATRLGDLALTGKATVVSNDRRGLRGGLGIAAIATVTLPTGDRSDFASEGAVTSSLRALVDYVLGITSLRAALGYTVRTERRALPLGPGDVTLGDSIPWAASVTLRPRALAPALDADDRQLWELGIHGELPAGPVAPFGLGDPGAPALSPVLLAADDRVALGRSRDAYVLAGVEVGLGSAVGVPAFRGVLALGWAPRAHDRDHDGVPDDRDECPDLAEDRDGVQDGDGCPEDDADDDGIPDEQDACPLVPGARSDDPRKNGCPAAPPSSGAAP